MTDNENPFRSPKHTGIASSSRQKSPQLAFTLNFFLPGAGLLYLGKPAWAAMNFIGVLLIGCLLAFALPDELFENYSRYIAMGIAGGCGGLAMAIAKQRIQPDAPPDVH
jgi:TM2 domain-containing membrane protein YozV